jgi:hypothetical protein
MSERERLERLIARDGMEAAKQWARCTAALYRRSFMDPTHYASQADMKQLFAESIVQLETFADTGSIP